MTFYNLFSGNQVKVICQYVIKQCPIFQFKWQFVNRHEILENMTIDQSEWLFPQGIIYRFARSFINISTATFSWEGQTNSSEQWNDALFCVLEMITGKIRQVVLHMPVTTKILKYRLDDFIHSKFLKIVSKANNSTNSPFVSFIVDICSSSSLETN